MIIVFSKDRAFQLEACLRSLVAHCADIADVPVRIVWTASQEKHERAYAILRKEYAPRTGVQFVREAHFRPDFLAVLGRLVPGSFGDKLVRMAEKVRAPWLKKMLRPLAGQFLRPAPAILYAVDDTLFLRPFSFTACARRLLATPQALAFSLRLGRGLVRFYMGHRDQDVPELTPLPDNAEVAQYRWPEADGDFAYPLEVSSSLLKSEVIVTRLLRKEWRTPNTLELALANMSGRYRHDFPLVLTYLEPRAVSVPLNMVQQDFTGNRHGGQARYDADSLCDEFLRGVRADLSGLAEMRSTSVHAEVEILPRNHS